MNRAAIAALIASAIGAGACRKKREDAAEQVAAREARAQPVPAAPVPAEPEPTPVASGKDPWLDAERVQPSAPVPTPAPVEPYFPIDKLVTTTDGPVDVLVDRVREVARTSSPEISVMKVSVSYVRKDGTLDPIYGRLDIEFALPDRPDGIVDDPNRPTGAPVPEVTQQAEATRTQCPTVSLAGARWSATESLCDKTKLVSGPRCSVASIWARAIPQGAPDNAVAIVRHDARRGMWSFRITDKVRNVDFNRSYRDDCPPAGKPVVKRNPYE